MGLLKSRKKKNLRPTREVVSDMSMRNSANALFANIRFMEVDSDIRSIAVTSSVPNEGKSTVTIALAMAVGAAGHSCLLVETDMRRRSLANTLGVHPRYGIGALLKGETGVAGAVVPTDLDGVFFLDAEPGIPAPEGILGSHRFEELMVELARGYDYVIYDTPPLGAFPDAAVIAGKADGTVLVMRENYTDRAEAVRSMEALKMVNAHVLGTVMNGQRSKADGGYGYAYSYAYTYAYKEVPVDDPRAKAQAAAKDADGSAGVATSPNAGEHSAQKSAR